MRTILRLAHLLVELLCDWLTQVNVESNEWIEIKILASAQSGNKYIGESILLAQQQFRLLMENNVNEKIKQ